MYSKTDFTYLRWLITFEPLELKKCDTSHLKVLIWGYYALDIHAESFLFCASGAKLVRLRRVRPSIL